MGRILRGLEYLRVSFKKEERKKEEGIRNLFGR